MARQAFGRQVVRGTICRDQYRAEVMVTCSDIPRVGQVTPVLVDVRWRTAQPSAGTGPDDARIDLAFVRRFDAATGDLRFERADGPVGLALPNDTGSRLLQVVAAAATAGADPDVLLQVSVDGEVAGGLPLSAAADPPEMEIRAGDGASAAPAGVVEGRAVPLRAVPAPAGAGRYEWFGVPAAVVEVRNPTADGGVEVVGHRGPAGGAGSVCVLFTPDGGGPAVLAGHRLAVDPDPGSASFTGRVADQLGRPVPAATVQLRSHSGSVLASGPTGPDGEFALAGPPRGCVVAAEKDGARAWATVEVAPPPAPPPVTVPMGNVPIRVPVVLAGTVGDGGDNQPDDVALVADRLVLLGRLTEADRTAEARAAGPRTLAAIYDHHAAAAGARLPLIKPGTLALLNAHPPVRPRRIPMTGPVGALPGARGAVPRNLVAEVHDVQDRLLQLGLLLAADLAADRAAEPPGAGPADRLADAALPRAAAAARRFDLRLAGGALRAIAPGRPAHRRLGDPMWFGRLPLDLAGSVGLAGDNVPADVRAVVSRLCDLGLLDAATARAESPARLDPAGPPETDRIDEATFPATVTALADLRQTWLGVPVPADGLLDALDPALAVLNTPPRSDRGAGLGLREAGQPAENLPADVRAVQDRLRLLGFLSEADWLRERLLPGRAVSPPAGGIAQTLAALRQFQLEVLAPVAGSAPPADPGLPFLVGPLDLPPPLALSGGVGTGQPNAAADVRAVQDRLAALRLLAPADHDRELADPARGTPAETGLPATLAALTTLRRRVFGRPDPAAGAAWAAHPRVLPGDETARFLDDPLAAGRTPVRLTGSVGALGWNHPAEVRAVADRLTELGLLATADAARVDPAGLAPLDDAAIAAVTEAIGALRRDFLGETGAPRRVEAAGPLVLLLGNPLLRFTGAPEDPDPRCGLTSRLDPAASVGTGGENRPADVRALQDRLRDLRLLAVPDHDVEAADPAATDPVQAGQLAATLAALGTFQDLMVPAARHPVTDYRGFRPAGHPVPGRVEPLDETLRMLDRPYRPPTAPLLLTSSVGAAPAANRGDDVRRLADRLHQLGYLDTADYLDTRPPAAGVTPVPATTMPATVAAIVRSQHLAGGFSPEKAGRVDPLGHAHRALQDPTWSTPALPNPHADYEHAGPAEPAQWDPSPAVHQEISDLVAVIEAQEAGRGAVGETASDLHTAARTPASYGSVQTIGATAAGALVANPDYAGFYDLRGALPGLFTPPAGGLVGHTQALVKAVTALVPAGATEAQLLAACATYSSAAQLASVRADCGLDAGDVLGVFRLGLLVRRLAAAVAAAKAAAATGGAKAARAAATTGVAAELGPGTPVQVSLDELGIPRSDLETMVAVNALTGENREGFIQRALFGGPAGQLVRNAETDDSGRKLGRFLVRDTYRRVRNAPGGAALTPRQRVIVVAHLHNHGESPLPLAAMIAHPEQPATFDATYAQPVVRRWDAAHPGAVGVGVFPP